MVINITCLKIPGSGFISAAFEYPSITNKEIIQYTSVLITQAPIRVCLDGTIIDSRTIIIVTMYLKKNQNAPRPSKHPPVMGKKCQNV